MRRKSKPRSYVYGAAYQKSTTRRMTAPMQTAALIVAAGRGTRVGGPLPKQYRRIGGRMVLTQTLDAFLAHPEIHVVQPVTHPDDSAAFENAVADLPEASHRKLRPAVAGRATRQQSVREGLAALARGVNPPDLVLIHDGARPFAGADLIARAIANAKTHGAALPGVAVTDTIVAVNEGQALRETWDRAALRAIQTPQSFAFSAILEAHERAAAAGLADFPDDGAVARWAGLSVAVFEGDVGNVKLTRDIDFHEAERRLGCGI